MKLNLEFNDEPLFPPNFLKSGSPFRSSHQATGSSTTGGGDADRSLGVNANGSHFQEENSSVDEEGEEGEASSSEAVIANLEAMDVSYQFLLRFTNFNFD